MDRSRILEILNDWNYWQQPAPTGTEREVLGQLEGLLDERHILTLTGVRRSGKRTLMRQLGEVAARRHSREQVLYVNFEDPRWLPELGSGLIDEIVEAYRERYSPGEKAFLLLDEVQNVPEWERWARAIYDRRSDLKMVVSASTASLVEGDLGALLTGRHLAVEVFPFSLGELVRHGGGEVPDGDYQALRRHKTRIRSALATYLEWGSFPETCGKPPEVARLILQQSFEDIIARDVVSRRGVRDARALRALAHYALTNVGNELSVTQTAKTLGISAETVREYLGYLEEVYLVFGVPYASPSLKVVNRRNEKMYAVDCGLRNVVSLRFSRDLGRSAENLAFLWLRHQGLAPRYWRNGAEVDFVVDAGGRRLPINVCCTDSIPAREWNSLQADMAALGASEGLIVSDDLYLEPRTTGDGRVAVMPLWYFLLKPLEAIFGELSA